MTDFTDTITVKMFARTNNSQIFWEKLKGRFLLKIKVITTIDKFDGELTIGSVTGLRRSGILQFQKRSEHAQEGGAPLSYKDERYGWSLEVKDIVKRAHDWGHPAIAITDHGVAQAFPDANHYIETLDKADPFKIILWCGRLCRR